MLAAVAALAALAPLAPRPPTPRPRAALAMQAGPLDGLRAAFDAALRDAQAAASEAAGQSANPWEASPAADDGADVLPLPDSFEEAVRLAAGATGAALADGAARLIVEFDASAGDETYNLLSRTLKLLEPYLARLEEQVLPPRAGGEGSRVQLLFPDEGTAAYVKQKWQLPHGTLCGSMPRAKFAAGVDAVMVIAPGATEVAGLQRLLSQVEEEAFDTPVLLFNPKLVDMQSTGYGLVGRELRAMVESSFDNCFCLKAYPEGALFRVFPGAFSVWREDSSAEGGYTLAYKGTKRPSGDEIDELLNPETDDGGQMMSGFSNFIKGFQAM
ncbi:hypothetical protein AB1Y20_006883 [Prymnesium parvum]|uniref:DUF1995 domain-containing protein n=1 Tax=Prymnesium parvum TaxID=97485 RepID=A0AB34IZM8_PRYPA